jgi:hypothetical protein
MLVKYLSHVAHCQNVLHVFLVLLEEGTQVKLCDEPIKAAFLVHFSTCALSRAIFIPAIVLFLFVFLETIVKSMQACVSHCTTRRLQNWIMYNNSTSDAFDLSFSCLEKKIKTNE